MVKHLILLTIIFSLIAFFLFLFHSVGFFYLTEKPSNLFKILLLGSSVFLLLFTYQRGKDTYERKASKYKQLKESIYGKKKPSAYLRGLKFYSGEEALEAYKERKLLKRITHYLSLVGREMADFWGINSKKLYEILRRYKVELSDRVELAGIHYKEDKLLINPDSLQRKRSLLVTLAEEISHMIRKYLRNVEPLSEKSLANLTEFDIQEFFGELGYLHMAKKLGILRKMSPKRIQYIKEKVDKEIKEFYKILSQDPEKKAAKEVEDKWGDILRNIEEILRCENEKEFKKKLYDFYMLESDFFAGKTLYFLKEEEKEKFMDVFTKGLPPSKLSELLKLYKFDVADMDKCKGYFRVMSSLIKYIMEVELSTRKEELKRYKYKRLEELATSITHERGYILASLLFPELENNPSLLRKLVKMPTEQLRRELEEKWKKIGEKKRLS